MKRAFLVSLPLVCLPLVCLLQFVIATSSLLFSQSNPPAHAISSPRAQAEIPRYGKLPLSFEANHGQSDPKVKFLSHGNGYSLFLTTDEAVFTLPASSTQTAPQPAPRTLRMKLLHSNPATQLTGVDQLPGTSNYFIGNRSTDWRTHIPTYAKVKYQAIYSGIDLVYYGNRSQLEYDFVVAPGADPHHIQLELRGTQRIRQDKHGSLRLNLGDRGQAEIRWLRPVAYQEINGARQPVAAHYTIAGNRIGFELAPYDPTRTLYIDPLLYSTYLGGSGGDGGRAIAVDTAGNAYITGATSSTNFPAVNPLQSNYAGNIDAFITKINPAGSALVYSTYLGGSGADQANGIAVDNAGNAYVAGFTESSDFPTRNPLQSAYAGGNGDAFVAEINPTGSALVYSTYLGGPGQDLAASIAVDSTGNAYITGNAGSGFPTTPGSFQPACKNNCAGADAFLTKISPSGLALAYSTYLGGSNAEQAFGIAIDTAGSAYVTGVTWSTDFPVTPGAYQTVCNNGSGCAAFGDAFVTKLNPAGSALVFSTYLGGSSYDVGYGIAVDSAGYTYVTGYTFSNNFPSNYLQLGLHGPQDAFVTKFNPTGSGLIYSTYLGGTGNDGGQSIAADATGNAYVTGFTYSTNFPTTPNPFQTLCGDVKCSFGDAFVSEINPNGSAFVYSTYLGGRGQDIGAGITLDSVGNAYLTGSTGSSNFPVTPGAFQTTYYGSTSFVTRIHLVSTTTALTASPNPSTYGEAVTLTAVVTSNLGTQPPDGEAVSFMKGKTLLGTAMLAGGVASFTTATLNAGTMAATAVYAGDPGFGGSSSTPVKQVVNLATTTTILASSVNPSELGQSVTFTATVTPEFNCIVKGTVTFYDGATVLATAVVKNGAARFATRTLTSGTHNITAAYNGTANFDRSSAALTQTVD